MCKIFGHNIKLIILVNNFRVMVNNTRKLVCGSNIVGTFLSNLNAKFQLLSFYDDKKIPQIQSLGSQYTITKFY